jgi:hypothetical protein
MDMVTTVPRLRTCTGNRRNLANANGARLNAQEATVPDLHDLENRFTYHAPKPGQPEIYEQIRFAGLGLALLIDRNAPESRELSLAITKIEEAVFWANAAIARNT